MPDQPRLIDDEAQELTVSAEEKAEYVERLRQKLQDSEFRQIDRFATAANRALRGIQLVELEVEDMLASLKRGRLPATVGNLEKRCHTFIEKNMRGYDGRNTRLTLLESHEDRE